MYMCIDKRSHENDIFFQYIVYIIFQMKTKDFNHYILHTYTNILSFLGLLMKKKTTRIVDLYVLFWKFILTLIYTFSENNISKLRLPWHTFLQVQKCLYWEALSNAHWNFFYFKSGEPIVVIILSLMMLFYLYNRVFFFLGCDCQFLCILTWGYYDAIWFFFFIFHGWKYFFHLFIFKIFNDFSILVTFKCICINGQI